MINKRSRITIMMISLCGCLLSSHASGGSNEAPGWFRHPHEQSGRLLGSGEGENKHEALTLAVMELARRIGPNTPSESAYGVCLIGRMQVAVLDKEWSSSGSVPGSDDEKFLSQSVKIFLKTDTSTLLVKYFASSKREKNGAVHDEVSLSFTGKKPGMKTLTDELRSAGVEIKTYEAPRKYYVMLSYAKPGPDRAASTPAAPTPAQEALPAWCRRESQNPGIVTGLDVGQSKFDAVAYALGAAVRSDPDLSPVGPVSGAEVSVSTGSTGHFGKIGVSSSWEPKKVGGGEAHQAITIWLSSGKKTITLGSTREEAEEKNFISLFTEDGSFNDLLTELSNVGVKIKTEEAGDQYCAQVSYAAHLAKREPEAAASSPAPAPKGP